MKVNLAVSPSGVRQCQSCNAEGSNCKLSACSGCGQGLYCSKECQRAHWSSHQSYCETRQRVQALVAELATGTLRRDLENCEAALKSWIQAHRKTMFWAMAQALNLQSQPENVLDTALFLHLVYLPSCPSAPVNTPPDSPQAFALADVGTLAISTLKDKVASLSNPSLVNSGSPDPTIQDLNTLLKTSQVRLKVGGGGVGVVVVMVHGYSALCQVVPLKVDHRVTEEEVKPDARWVELLCSALHRGVRV